MWKKNQIGQRHTRALGIEINVGEGDNSQHVKNSRRCRDAKAELLTEGWKLLREAWHLLMPGQKFTPTSNPLKLPWNTLHHNVVEQVWFGDRNSRSLLHKTFQGDEWANIRPSKEEIMILQYPYLVFMLNWLWDFSLLKVIWLKNFSCNIVWSTNFHRFS